MMDSYPQELKLAWEFWHYQERIAWLFSCAERLFNAKPARVRVRRDGYFALLQAQEALDDFSDWKLRNGINS